MKKIFGIVTAAALMLSAALPAGAAHMSSSDTSYGSEWDGYESTTTANFSDISGHWAEDNINRAYDKGWISGYPDGSFRPDASITRGEAVKVFDVFMGIEPSTPETNYYTYTNKTSWVIPYMESGKKLLPQYLDGQGTAVLEEQPITREDTVYALVLALKYDDKVEYADQSVLNMFSDKGSISANLKPYVSVAVSNGFVSGYDDGTFGGTDPLTRAEFATLLARASTKGYGTGSGLNSVADIVADATISEVSVNPSGSVTMQIGETLDLTATAKMSDGQLQSYTNVSPQSSSSCVTVEGTTLKAVSEGTATINFLNDTYLADTSIQVTVIAPTDEPVFTSINYDSTTTGETVAITGRVSDPSGASLTLTVNGEDVSITSGTFTKNVNLNVGSNTFTFVLTNSYGVSAEKVVKITREAATVSVTPTPTPSALNDNEGSKTTTGYEWSVSSLDLNVGDTSRIKLFEVFSDGSKEDCTSDVELITSDSGVFTIASNGTVTAVGAGTAKLSFSQGLSAASVSMPRSITIKVNAVTTTLTLTSLEWSTSSVTVKKGATADVKLYGVYSDGSKKDMTAECDVYADDESVATFSGSTVTGVAAGTTMLWFGSIPSNNITLPAPCNVTITE